MRNDLLKIGLVEKEPDPEPVLAPVLETHYHVSKLVNRIGKAEL